MEKVSQPVRILAIVIVLVGAAGMLALRMLGPSPVVETTATVVPHTVATPKPKAKATPGKATPTAAKPKAKAKPKATAKPAAAKPKPKPAVPVNAPLAEIEPTGFPLAVDAALRRHAVVVVSLVVPGARVDALSAAEAEAGAKLSGAGYLSLNVLNEAVARSLLLADVGVKEPRVLVLTRSGEVAMALVGFADRETVAQAAANARL